MHRFPILLLLVALLCTAWGVAGEPPQEPLLQGVGPFGGDVRSLAVHPAKPDTFFLGTADGQIFKSSDAGQSWFRLQPGLKRRNLVVDNFHFNPRSPDTLYAGAWETKSDLGWLFVSHDGGQQWQEIPLGRFHSSIRAIAIAPSDPSVIALGISEGVILSQDGGQNWERITRGYRSLHNVESLVFDPHDSQTLYVGTWRRGWKTLDRGQKWIPIHQGMAFDSDMFSLLVSPDDPSTLYSSACTGVYKSLNGGDNWIKLSNGLPKDARRTRMLHLDPNDSQTLYAGTTLGLYRTENGGDSFSEILPGVVINAIAVHPANSNIVLVGTDDAGIFRSTDGGVTFKLSNQGFTHRQISALAASYHDGQVYAAISADGSHGGFYYADESLLDWTRYNDGIDSATASVIRSILPSATSKQVLLLAGRSIYRGIPGQSPWREAWRAEKLRIRDMAWTNQENDLLLASDEGIHRLSLSTSRLSKLTIPVYQGPVFSVVSDSPSRSAFAGTEMGVFESTDSGKSWQIRARGMPYATVELLKMEGDRIYAATTQGLYFSQDRGQSWKRSSGVSRTDLADLAVHSNSLSSVYAADLDLGELFRSNDGGQAWSRVDLGDAPSRISALLITSSGSLLAGTLSDGLYLISKQESATGGQAMESHK